MHQTDTRMQQTLCARATRCRALQHQPNTVISKAPPARHNCATCTVHDTRTTYASRQTAALQARAVPRCELGGSGYLGVRAGRPSSELRLLCSPSEDGRSGRSCGTASGARRPSHRLRRCLEGSCAAGDRPRRRCDRSCQHCRRHHLSEIRVRWTMYARRPVCVVRRAALTVHILEHRRSRRGRQSGERQRIGHRTGNLASNDRHFRMYGTPYPTLSAKIG
jgi:hypothetical protein